MEKTFLITSSFLPGLEDTILFLTQKGGSLFQICNQQGEPLCSELHSINDLQKFDERAIEALKRNTCHICFGETGKKALNKLASFRKNPSKSNVSSENKPLSQTRIEELEQTVQELKRDNENLDQINKNLKTTFEKGYSEWENQKKIAYKYVKRNVFKCFHDYLQNIRDNDYYSNPFEIGHTFGLILKKEFTKSTSTQWSPKQLKDIQQDLTINIIRKLSDFKQDFTDVQDIYTIKVRDTGITKYLSELEDLEGIKININPVFKERIRAMHDAIKILILSAKLSYRKFSGGKRSSTYENEKPLEPTELKGNALDKIDIESSCREVLYCLVENILDYFFEVTL